MGRLNLDLIDFTRQRPRRTARETNLTTPAGEEIAARPGRRWPGLRSDCYSHTPPPEVNLDNALKIVRPSKRKANPLAGSFCYAAKSTQSSDPKSIGSTLDLAGISPVQKIRDATRLEPIGDLMQRHRRSQAGLVSNAKRNSPLLSTLRRSRFPTTTRRRIETGDFRSRKRNRRKTGGLRFAESTQWKRTRPTGYEAMVDLTVLRTAPIALPSELSEFRPIAWIVLARMSLTS